VLDDVSLMVNGHLPTCRRIWIGTHDTFCSYRNKEKSSVVEASLSLCRDLSIRSSAFTCLSMYSSNLVQACRAHSIYATYIFCQNFNMSVFRSL